MELQVGSPYNLEPDITGDGFLFSRALKTCLTNRIECTAQALMDMAEPDGFVLHALFNTCMTFFCRLAIKYEYSQSAVFYFPLSIFHFPLIKMKPPHE